MTHVQRVFSLRVPRVELRCAERDTMPRALGLGLGADPPSAQTLPGRAPDLIAELQVRPRWELPWRPSGNHNPLHCCPAPKHAVAGSFRRSA